MVSRTFQPSGGCWHVLLAAATLGIGCTEATPNYCEKNSDCTGGRVCDMARAVCSLPDGATGPLDGPTSVDTAPIEPEDAPYADDVEEAADTLGTYDGSQEHPATDGAAVDDVPVDDAAIEVMGPDTRVPDASGTCGVDGDCLDPTKSFCVAGVCASCQTAGPNACGALICDESSGRCVECTDAAQCTRDPAKGFCVANTCAGCDAAGGTVCSARTDGRNVCAHSGVTAGQCVECADAGQCTQDPAKSFCVANLCVGCSATGGTGCSARTDGRIRCASAGTVIGQCVECDADDQCTKDATKSFCVANACVGCQSAAATACASRSALAPVCGATGVCIQCSTSADCTVATKPICTANACGACTADSQCVAKLGPTGNPGVCIDTDGHCAMDAETVYVENVMACQDTNPGTASAPVCSAPAGVGLAKASSKSLVVITGTLAASPTTSITAAAPLTIVGKSNAKLTPTPGSDGITINAGQVTLRGVAVLGGTSTGMGINASPTSGNTVTLHMDTCVVSNNPGGGILLNGAAFEIKNSTITNNGPGQLGVATWGGILVNSVPANGPTTLDFLTVQNNNPVGISCSGNITGTGVLATGNTSAQIGNCGFTSCSAFDGGANCGSQTTPP